MSRIHNTGLNIGELEVFKSMFQIRIQSDWVCEAGYVKAKTTQKSKSEEFSCLEELQVLFGGPEVSPEAWTQFIQAWNRRKAIFNIIFDNFTSLNFSFLVTRKMDPDLDSPETLITNQLI